jgi:hypothetical protein
MTIDSFDFKSLQTRIDAIKQEGKENTEFTYEFIECLLDRYNLKECTPENHELQDVPDIILEKILQGKAPTKEELLLMDSDTQNYLLFELIYFCGMGMIASFDYHNNDITNSENSEETPTFDVILSMRDLTQAHYLGSYMVAALTLLMGSIPSPELIELLTNNFSLNEEQIEKNFVTISEISASIIMKYREEVDFWCGKKDAE